MKIKSYSRKEIQSASAMKASITMTRSNPAAKAYWSGVKLCVAKPDGFAESHHMDGHVEHFDVKLVGNKPLVTSGSQSRDALRHGGSQFCHAILMKGENTMGDMG